MLAPGPRALPFAIGVTAVALFGVGALLSLFTGRSALAFGRAHAGAGRASPAPITYAIGRLAGIAIG